LLVFRAEWVDFEPKRAVFQGLCQGHGPGSRGRLVPNFVPATATSRPATVSNSTAGAGYRRTLIQFDP
jgi:hypothetical protein